MPNWTVLSTLSRRDRVISEQGSLHATLYLLQKTWCNNRYRTKQICDAFKSSELKIKPSRGAPVIVAFRLLIQSTSAHQQGAIQTHQDCMHSAGEKCLPFLFHEA